VGYDHESRLPAPSSAGTGAGRQRHESDYYSDQVGYFLSPLDFLKECLTFFLFKAAFNRLVFFRLFMFSSVRTLTLSLSPEGRREGGRVI